MKMFLRIIVNILFCLCLVGCGMLAEEKETENSETSSENIENFYYGDEKNILFYVETREKHKIVGITICNKSGRYTKSYAPKEEGSIFTHPFHMEEEIYRFSEIDEDEKQVGMVIFNRSGEELFSYRTETLGNFIRIAGGGKMYSIIEYDKEENVVNNIELNLEVNDEGYTEQ